MIYYIKIIDKKDNLETFKNDETMLLIIINIMNTDMNISHIIKILHINMSINMMNYIQESIKEERNEKFM